MSSRSDSDEAGNLMGQAHDYWDVGQIRRRPRRAKEYLAWPSDDPVALDVGLRDVRCRADATTEVRGVHLDVRIGERVALTGVANSAGTAMLTARRVAAVPARWSGSTR
ncbi:hypothetical protein ACIPSA_35270 [Streptomyces sp. NPDC086549]|uniref:hypothetical protein n=1 Tax=Streptomyces sp. NPDC086549 TaxID=3365752 RepID=UPI0037F2F0DE